MKGIKKMKKLSNKKRIVKSRDRIKNSPKFIISVCNMYVTHSLTYLTPCYTRGYKQFGGADGN